METKVVYSTFYIKSRMVLNTRPVHQTRSPQFAIALSSKRAPKGATEENTSHTGAPWDLLQSIPRAISDRMIKVPFDFVSSRVPLQIASNLEIIS